MSAAAKYLGKQIPDRRVNRPDKEHTWVGCAERHHCIGTGRYCNICRPDLDGQCPRCVEKIANTPFCVWCGNELTSTQVICWFCRISPANRCSRNEISRNKLKKLVFWCNRIFLILVMSGDYTAVVQDLPAAFWFLVPPVEIMSLTTRCSIVYNRVCSSLF